MSARKSSLWCVVKKCNNITEKRHFFLFPKERDRWLQWIHACGRFDLEVMSPEYAHRNYRLCHLHFEEKWYKIGKSRAHLHPDAVPTIFFERSDIQSLKAMLSMDGNAEIAKPSTSSSMYSALIKETPRKKKLKEQNLELKAENRMQEN